MTARSVIAACLVNVGLVLAARGAEAPPAAFVISMAQQFVAENFERPADKHFSISFDITQIHPQPGGDYWAVVGGFAAKTSSGSYRRHVYVAAVRLVCPSFEKLECWRVEKLAIDGNILIDLDRETAIR